MTFIIHHPDGTREQYSNHYDEDIESERDAAFECDYPDFIIDDDSIDKAISDLKKAIKLLLSNID